MCKGNLGGSNEQRAEIMGGEAGQADIGRPTSLRFPFRIIG